MMRSTSININMLVTSNNADISSIFRVSSMYEFMQSIYVETIKLDEILLLRRSSQNLYLNVIGKYLIGNDVIKDIDVIGEVSKFIHFS